MEGEWIHGTVKHVSLSSRAVVVVVAVAVAVVALASPGSSNHMAPIGFSGSHWSLILLLLLIQIPFLLF